MESSAKPGDSSDFNTLAHDAMLDTQLQRALNRARSGFVEKRIHAVNAVNDFELMRNQAQWVKQKSLANLEPNLLEFERQVQAMGGHVHWAENPQQMQEIVVDICQQVDAKKVAKGKSMVGEEAQLNEALIEAGIKPIETDLGEYIIQLANEKPSHIVAPALHKTREQVVELFKNAHLLGERSLQEVKDIVDEARSILRKEFLSADVGITGANILIAQTGTAVVVTNEGNGDLSAALPNTHIITTSIDKVLSSWEDASSIISVLARSATGQTITSYTSFFNGPKKESDRDGPENFHIVLLDNGRSQLLGGEFEDMLHCIRCGACMNHCPIYQNVGGHSYNSVYPGPMGSVLSPLLFSASAYANLPNASTFCGRCESVCPVKIPLPKLLRKLRDRQPKTRPLNLGAWLTRSFTFIARHPKLYRFTVSMALKLIYPWKKSRPALKRFPGAKHWTGARDLPSPPPTSFQSQWKKQNKGGSDDQ